MSPDTPLHFDRVAILGVGLLGCSLGLALRERGLATEITGVGRRQVSLETALQRGAINRFTQQVEEGVKAADLVVLATPAGSVQDLLDLVRTHAPATAVVTDVTSTKAAICAHAAASWAAPRRFIGSHPMAGSERFGPEHGSATLYQDTVCLVEAAPELDALARARVVGLWQAVGARVVDINPGEHDALLARTSHLPHILASAIALIAAQSGDIRPLIGNGFRDMTRIAAGRPEIWRDICLTNREAVLETVQELKSRMEDFAGALSAADGPALEAFFEAGRLARKKAVE